jgi:hypothetical protein
MLVYQHHERRDGSGYPVGLCDEEVRLPYIIGQPRELSVASGCAD